MNRVVVDTNVIVSALIGKGNPNIVINTIFQGRVTLVLSNAIIAEYERVLQRPKFSRYSEFTTYASATIKSLQSIAQLVETTITVRVCPDPDDDIFLELAVAANAQYFVTGNKRHFPFDKYRSTRILSPREFVAIFK